MIRNALQRFMYGRYGNDQLNTALLILYVALYVLYFLTRIELFYWISFVAILFALFRMLSRNPARRRAENAKFLKVAGPAIQWLRMRRTIHRDKEHCLFQVPQLRTAAPGAQGQGKDHRHLPQLRRRL